MEKRSWKDQKLHIFNMIKNISDYYGGDDAEWLKDYANLVIERHKDDLSIVVACFEDLLAQTKTVPHRTRIIYDPRNQ